MLKAIYIAKIKLKTGGSDIELINILFLDNFTK